MKIREIFKEIFSLAIRLLGIYFLWAGLNDLNVPTLMNVQMLKSDQVTDIISAILPAVFNLVVAWWLFGGALTRRAYPKELTLSDYFSSRSQKVSEEVKAPQPQGSTSMDLADKKLAALVAKDKEERPAK